MEVEAAVEVDEEASDEPPVEGTEEAPERPKSHTSRRPSPVAPPADQVVTPEDEEPKELSDQDAEADISADETEQEVD